MLLPNIKPSRVTRSKRVLINTIADIRNENLKLMSEYPMSLESTTYLNDNMRILAHSLKLLAMFKD